MSTICEFTGTCGDNSNATGKLVPNGVVSLNGNEDLSSCMTGNDDACAYSIRLIKQAGIYSYSVQVDCQGPSGWGSGFWHLKFEDETGDVYTLNIYDSSRKTHQVSYNSQKPNIVKILWNN